MSKLLINKTRPFISRGHSLLGDSVARYLITILAISIFLLPILHLYIPEDNMFHVSSYTISLLGK